MSTKLPIVDGDKLRRALQRAGFVVIRVRGSAHFIEHGDGRRTTLSAILDDVGISADELRDLL